MWINLLKALTYHAILPSTICIGMASFYFQIIGVRNSFIDGMIFIVRNLSSRQCISVSLQFGCIPAVFNPILTLYFVAPYRKYPFFVNSRKTITCRRILTVIGRVQINTVPAVTTSFLNKESPRVSTRMYRVSAVP